VTNHTAISWKPISFQNCRVIGHIFSFQQHRFLHRKHEILKWHAIVRQTFLAPLKQQRLRKLILQGSQTKIDEDRKMKLRGCLGVAPGMEQVIAKPKV
jgi:hypothetical protein